MEIRLHVVVENRLHLFVSTGKSSTPRFSCGNWAIIELENRLQIFECQGNSSTVRIIDIHLMNFLESDFK